MENQNVEQVIDKLSEQLKSMLKTETVIGEEFTLGEYTCKPVIRVGMGFGTGTGSGSNDGKHQKQKCHEGNGTGAGAGLGIFPVGFLATKEGELTFIPAGNKKGIHTLFEKIPDIVDKLSDLKTENEK